MRNTGRDVKECDEQRCNASMWWYIFTCWLKASHRVAVWKNCDVSSFLRIGKG